jgi:hypothetical protein
VSIDFEVFTAEGLGTMLAFNRQKINKMAGRFGALVTNAE